MVAFMITLAVLFLITGGGLAYFGITQVDVFLLQNLLLVDILLIAVGIITLLGGLYFIYSLIRRSQ
jgi:hypothetical protein